MLQPVQPMAIIKNRKDLYTPPTECSGRSMSCRRWTARPLTRSLNDALAVVAAATKAVGEKIAMEEKFWNWKMEIVRRKHNHILSLFNLHKVLVEKKQGSCSLRRPRNRRPPPLPVLSLARADHIGR